MLNLIAYSPTYQNCPSLEQYFWQGIVIGIVATVISHIAIITIKKVI